MDKKYQNSLDLFEEIYFNEKGRLDKKSFRESQYGRDSKRYMELGRDKGRDNRSKIIGKSAFTPKIIRERNLEEPDLGDNYFLTLDAQGRFDHHLPLQYLNKDKRINVTMMTKEEIMTKVEQLLNMTNEEIMTMFNIESNYLSNINIALILDDVISNYFEQQGQKFEKTYYPEKDITIKSEKEEIVIGTASLKYGNLIMLKEGSNQKEFINYEILTGIKSDIDAIRVDIKDVDVNSELGKVLLRTLEERFVERQLTEKQSGTKTEHEGEEKTGAEKIIEYMRQNNLDSQDLVLAVTMVLARTADKTNAEQHIVMDINKDRESFENIK